MPPPDTVPPSEGLAEREIVYSEVIVGDGEITNYNFFWPYHLIERKAAEKGYKDNIRQLIEDLKSYEI